MDNNEMNIEKWVRHDLRIVSLLGIYLETADISQHVLSFFCILLLLENICIVLTYLINCIANCSAGTVFVVPFILAVVLVV